jgi:hypothetical protein
MNIVNETFSKLQRRNNTLTAYDFSTEWLKKSKGYYAYLQSTGAEPSYDAVLGLYGTALKQQKHWNNYIERNKSKHDISHLEGVADFYRQLTEQIETKIKKTAISM